MTHIIYLQNQGLAVNPGSDIVKCRARSLHRRRPLTWLEQFRLARAAFDGDRGRVPLAGDRLDDLDPDPFEAEVRDQSLGDALRGRLDELELPLDEDALDRVRAGGVVEGVPEVIAARGPGDVARHVHGEGERLLDLALPVVHPDDGGDLQVPDGHDVSHTVDASRGHNGP